MAWPFEKLCIFPSPSSTLKPSRTPEPATKTASSVTGGEKSLRPSKIYAKLMAIANPPMTSILYFIFTVVAE